MIRQYHLDVTWAKCASGRLVEPTDPPTDAEMDAHVAALLHGMAPVPIQRDDGGRWVLFTLSLRPIGEPVPLTCEDREDRE